MENSELEDTMFNEWLACLLYWEISKHFLDNRNLLWIDVLIRLSAVVRVCITGGNRLRSSSKRQIY